MNNDETQVVFLDIDPDTLKKIIETHTDVKHILESLDEGKQTFKEHSERLRTLEQKTPDCYTVHDKRLRELEQKQAQLNGKLGGIVIIIGAGVTIVTNVIVWGWAKMRLG